MNNQFSQLISVVLSHSREAASRLRNKSIYPDHLMLGILADENNRVIRILQKLHIDIQFLKQNIEEALKETEINKEEEESIEVSLSASSSKILKMSILEALAHAGDLSIYGKRDNVMLIRENSNGQKSIHILNLNDANLINSPYYYLQQNDVVIVQPNKVKAQNSSVGSMTTLWFSATSILISLTSLLYNILK